MPPSAARPASPARRPGAAGRRPPYALRRTVAGLALLLVFAVVAALVSHAFAPRRSPGAPSASAAVTSAAPPAPLHVGITDCLFVDTSRSTYDYATGATTPGRHLVTEIRYPTTSGPVRREDLRARPAYRRGPFPLVVFAPGYDVDPSEYRPLLDAWVRAGFVVAAPIFPDTNPAAVRAAPVGSNPEEDLRNQPGDVAFVTRRLEAARDGTSANCAFVRGLVAPGPVALAGQSDGGNTIAALAYEKADAALRAGLDVVAAAVLSGAPLDDTAGAYGPGPALLFVQSAHDACNTPQQAALLYNEIVQGDRWFLETESRTHIGPYNGREPAAFAVVARVTTAFLRAELLGGGATTPLLQRALGAVPALAHLSAGGPAPAMAPLQASIPACYADVVASGPTR